MHRAHVGNLEEALALRFFERARELDRALKAVDLALSCLAFGAIRRVNLVVAQPDDDPLERQSLALRIHPQRHRRAGAEGRKQIVIGPRPAIVAASGFRFVGRKAVRTDGNRLGVAAFSRFGHHDLAFPTSPVV